MRPACSSNVAMADCLPSISGRGLLPSPISRTAMRHGRNNAAFSTKKPVLSSSSYPLSIEQQTEQPGIGKDVDAIPISSKPVRDTKQLRLSLPPRPGERKRDTEGRSLAGRRRPLKINLDLALVRSQKLNSP